MKAAWTNRLTMFAELKNALDFTSKKMQMTMRPTMIGIAPLSPPRIRIHQAAQIVAERVGHVRCQCDERFRCHGGTKGCS